VADVDVEEPPLLHAVSASRLVRSAMTV
jgi:hypothetical protein